MSHVARVLCFLVGLMVPLACCVNDLSAQVNVALGKTIIDGSGSWDGGVPEVGAPFDGGTFPARYVVDGGITEPTDGVVTYWLGREYTDNEYFTLDLGQSYNIDSIELFNTHNRQYNDRGTDEFVLYASNSIDANRQLVTPVPILAGNLVETFGQDEIEGELFTSVNGLTPTNARYLKFEALSYYSSASNGSSGLNEIRVFDSSLVNPNKALGKPVIDGSGAWEGGVVGEGVAFNEGQFPATAVTDGSIADSDTAIWLGREGVANEYFTLDLGGPVSIQEIVLRNTTNRQYNDRGTREFRIAAANAVDGANQLVNPVEILEGQLANSAGVSPLLQHVFTAGNGLTPTTARYLRFESLGETYFNDNVGLNEIEVYDSVQHEPTPPPRNNIAYGKPVIDGSGSWDGAIPEEGAPFDGGTFPADRVTDGSFADINTGRTSYWLGREYTNDEYFTLDLGEVFTVEEISLRNTHNTQYNDRGTDEFVIYGATEVDGNNQLLNPITLVSGNLSNVASASPIPADVFTTANGLNVADVRYVQFVALTYLESATNGSSGLNEIEIYGHLAGVLPGDFNGDGNLTAADIDLLSAAVRAGGADLTYDVNGDGAVNQVDREAWVVDLKSTYFGDANLDGEFSSADFVTVFQAGQYEDGVAMNSGWATGDWNGDAAFDSADFVAAFQAGGYELGPRAGVAAVPEPAGCGMLCLVFGWMVAPRARRK